jgi:hypothetical protein
VGERGGYFQVHRLCCLCRVHRHRRSCVRSRGTPCSRTNSHVRGWHGGYRQKRAVTCRQNRRVARVGCCRAESEREGVTGGEDREAALGWRHRVAASGGGGRSGYNCDGQSGGGGGGGVGFHNDRRRGAGGDRRDDHPRPTRVSLFHTQRRGGRCGPGGRIRRAASQGIRLERRREACGTGRRG